MLHLRVGGLEQKAEETLKMFGKSLRRLSILDNFHINKNYKNQMYSIANCLKSRFYLIGRVAYLFCDYEYCLQMAPL